MCRRRCVARQIETGEPIHQISRTATIGAGRRGLRGARVTKDSEQIVEVVAGLRRGGTSRWRLHADGSTCQTFQAGQLARGLLVGRGRGTAVEIDVQQILDVVLRLRGGCGAADSSRCRSGQRVLTGVLKLFPGKRLLA